MTLRKFYILPVLTFLCWGSYFSVSGQIIPAFESFQERAERINQYFADNPGASGYKQWKRKEWFYEPRLYGRSTPINLAQHTVMAHRQYLKTMSPDRSTHGSWIFLGPTTWTAGDGGKGGNGRVNSIDFDPNNADIIYIGTSNGGIWKSTNDGSSWTNISPDLPLLAIADIEISPTNSNYIYVLTGDGDPAPDPGDPHGQADITSIGVIRSTDGGSTWYPTGLTFPPIGGIVPFKLLMHPSDHNIQFVVHEEGIFKTTNAWSSHDTVYSGLAYDLEFKPGDPMTMYASTNNDILRSNNMGDDFTLVTDTDFSFGSTSRIELAVSPDLSSVVYALASNWDEMTGFYRSLNSGLSGSWVLRDDTTSSMGKFGPYCIGLEVDPLEYTDVYGGMQFINRNLDSGDDGDWVRITSGSVHADVHDVKINNGKLYVACDGGVFRSSNQGDSWTDISVGLAIMEIYRMTGTPQNILLQYCGAQDNGNNRRIGSSNFVHVTGGDGMVPLINYTDEDIVYTSTQNGSMQKSIDGGDNFVGLDEPGGDGAWISPLIMDPADPEIIFLGKSSLYRSDEGAENNTWQNLGSPWSGNLNCLAQGTSNRNRLYASAGPNIYRTDNALVASGNASFTNVTAGLPGLFITDIVVDPINSLRVFITLSGFTDGQKVYFSFNGGSTWSNISGSLPNVPINCMAFDVNGASDATYIGTDIGVFYRDLDLGDWIYFSNFMPSVIVNDLYINPTNGRVYAGTYGRGLWSSLTYSGCVANLNFAHPGTPISGTRHYAVSDQITSAAEFANDLGTDIVYRAGGRVILTPGFRSRALATFHASTGPCPPIFEPMTIMPPVFPQGRWMDGDVVVQAGIER